MVDVMGKPKTHRIAVARAAVVLTADLSDLIPQWQGLAEIMEAARYAGILAAKQTAKLIPLCHPILIDSVIVEIRPSSHRFEVEAIAQIVERTGVEMEAMTACAMTALSLVGALQDGDPSVSVEELTLWHKSGGRSGVWHRSDDGAGATSGGVAGEHERGVAAGPHLKAVSSRILAKVSRSLELSPQMPDADGYREAHGTQTLDFAPEPDSSRPCVASVSLASPPSCAWRPQSAPMSPEHRPALRARWTCSTRARSRTSCSKWSDRPSPGRPDTP